MYSLVERARGISDGYVSRDELVEAGGRRRVVAVELFVGG